MPISGEIILTKQEIEKILLDFLQKEQILACDIEALDLGVLPIEGMMSYPTKFKLLFSYTTSLAP